MSLRPLPKELQEKAATELNEDPNRIEDDLNYIHEWINKQPHLKVNQDNQWLIGFLRGCKFSFEKTKRKLDLYHTVRSSFPELFHSKALLSPEIQIFLQCRIIAKLPDTSDILAPQRFLIRFKTADPEKLSVINAFSGMLMLLDVLIYNDDLFVVNGHEVIVDFKNLNFDYVVQITPDNLKKIQMILLHAYPIRYKAVYYLNIPEFLKNILNIFISLLSEKYKKRLHCFSKEEIENLYKYIPRSIIPKDYGGYAESFDKLSEELKVYLENRQEWLLESTKYGVDETKRIEKPHYSTEYFNFEGSFRKLEID